MLHGKEANARIVKYEPEHCEDCRLGGQDVKPSQYDHPVWLHDIQVVEAYVDYIQFQGHASVPKQLRTAVVTALDAACIDFQYSAAGQKDDTVLFIKR